MNEKNNNKNKEIWSISEDGTNFCIEKFSVVNIKDIPKNRDFYIKLASQKDYNKDYKYKILGNNYLKASYKDSFYVDLSWNFIEAYIKSNEKLEILIINNERQFTQNMIDRLSENELTCLKFALLTGEYKYLVRDIKGNVSLFSSLPRRDLDLQTWLFADKSLLCQSCINLDKSWFSEIVDWEDEQPLEIEKLRKFIKI